MTHLLHVSPSPISPFQKPFALSRYSIPFQVLLLRLPILGLIPVLHQLDEEGHSILQELEIRQNRGLGVRRLYRGIGLSVAERRAGRGVKVPSGARVCVEYREEGYIELLMITGESHGVTL